MVTIFCPDFGEFQSDRAGRTASPSIWTVQAPHSAIPQPYLVPVRPSCSRSAISAVCRGSAGLDRLPVDSKLGHHVSPVLACQQD